MTGTNKIVGTVEAWEKDELGNDAKFARAVSKEITEQIDGALCLQSISIRLEKKLIDSFKLLGDFHGVGYQPLMRDALNRFADSEMKAIVLGIVESQKNQKQQKKPRNDKHATKHDEAMEKKCA